MPACEKHGHMNCRECFPRPSVPMARRCTSINQRTGHQCQAQCNNGVSHEGPHHRTDSLGSEEWVNLREFEEAWSEPVLAPIPTIDIPDDDIPF